jgi:hypothetical protein
MNLDKFLNLLATVFGALGSIYVMLAILALSPEVAADQAVSKFDFNPASVDALANQKGDTFAGLVFVIAAFLLAFVALAFVPDGVRVFRTRGVALALTAVLAGGLYLAMHFVGGGIGHHQKLAMGRVLSAQYLDGLIKQHRVQASDLDSIRVYLNLLELGIPKNEPAKSAIGRLAAAAGKALPPDLDYSAVEQHKPPR